MEACLEKMISKQDLKYKHACISSSGVDLKKNKGHKKVCAWLEKIQKSSARIHVYPGLPTLREEIAFTAWPKIQSQSQIFKYGRSIFCLPHQPNFSDIFDLCLHWVSVVRGLVELDYCNPTYTNLPKVHVMQDPFWHLIYNSLIALLLHFNLIFAVQSTSEWD